MFTESSRHQLSVKGLLQAFEPYDWFTFVRLARSTSSIELRVICLRSSNTDSVK